ncbi:MAG TPA: c-type cytochrome [Noviherbaspirillum sp.]|nr:c-type cytochrome [Noviherbaspirillum sp.]
MRKSFLLLTACIAVFCHASAFAGEAEIDAAAAEALARRESCFKCHAIDKKKDGPSYKDVAKKYRGKDGAEAKLLKHLTSGEVVKMASGEEDEHRIVKPKDEGELRNLVRWILSM